MPTLISKILISAAGLASVGSFIAIFFVAPVWQGYIALFCIILFLLVILIIIYKRTSSFIKNKFTDDYILISSCVKYETDESGSNIKYDVLKSIQCKRVYLEKVKHGYQWSGSKTPKISSELQKVGYIEKAKSNHDFDRVNLILKHPLLFDDPTIIHVSMDLNDSDGKSKPYLSSKVSQAVHWLEWYVILKHKSNSYKSMATIRRRLISSQTLSDYETIDEISFNNKSKQYYYKIANPEPGYFYSIEWKK